MKPSHLCLHVLAFAIAVGCALTLVVRYLKPPASLTDGVPELDSFAEPSLAAAVFKKHAEDLVWAYTLSRYQEGIAKNPAHHDFPGQWDHESGNGGNTRLPWMQVRHGNRPAALPSSISGWIQRFKAAIRQRQAVASAAELDNDNPPLK